MVLCDSSRYFVTLLVPIARLTVIKLSYMYVILVREVLCAVSCPAHGRHSDHDHHRYNTSDTGSITRLLHIGLLDLFLREGRTRILCPGVIITLCFLGPTPAPPLAPVAPPTPP